MKIHKGFLLEVYMFHAYILFIAVVYTVTLLLRNDTKISAPNKPNAAFLCSEFKPCAEFCPVWVTDTLSAQKSVDIKSTK